MTCAFRHAVRPGAPVLVAVFVLLGSVPGRVRAEDPPKDLTVAEREELQKKGAALDEEVNQLYGQGKYAEATARAEQALAMFQRL
jgi:hypothetical protein